jgi:putative RecB family exonuclease
MGWLESYKTEEINSPAKNFLMSYSKITAYEQCPLKFKYQFIEKIPTDTSPVLFLGQVVHETLEQFYKQGMDTGLEDLQDLFREIWKQRRNEYREKGELTGMSKDHEREFGIKGLDMLANFHASNLNKPEVPPVLEEFARATLPNGIPYIGRIDRMDLVGENAYVVIDYKTGKLNKKYLDFDQLLSYAWVMAENGYNIVGAMYYFLAPNVTEVQEIQLFTLTEIRDRLTARCSKVYEALGKSEFEPKRGILCKWCDYQNMCPLFIEELG